MGIEERSAAIVVGKPQWFLDDHLRLFSRTPVSCDPADEVGDTDGLFEVLWESDNEEDDFYFRKRTYCDSKKINRHQMSFETRSNAVDYAKKQAIERLNAAKKDVSYWESRISKMI